MAKKKGDFNFEWLFALIAGGAILILAVYGATKIGDTQRYQTDSEVAKQISIITDPMQAGFASGSYGKIIFSQETKINNECYSREFGRNDISVSSRSGVGEEWNLPGTAIPVDNKYIFSSDNAPGKEFYVFSKPFYMSYKVSDLIFLNSQQYCFVLSEDTYDIENELNGLKMGNIEVVDDAKNCSDTATRVCFGKKCDISVYGTCNYDCNSIYDEGYVEKNEQKFEYVGSLMYAAVFSDKSIYDCNVKRLLYRTGKIAEVYSKKAELMNARDCNTNLQTDMLVMAGEAQNSTNVNYIYQIAKNIDKKKGELCGLF